MFGVQDNNVSVLPDFANEYNENFLFLSFSWSNHQHCKNTHILVFAAKVPTFLISNKPTLKLDKLGSA